MKAIAGLVALVATGVLFAADPPRDAVIRPGGRVTVEIGQNIRFVYPYDKEQETKFKCLLVGDQRVVRLKEVNMGNETYVTYSLKKEGTYKVVLEAFVGPLENARSEKHNYTVVVKKKDE